jgi:hypothetical protein
LRRTAVLRLADFFPSGARIPQYTARHFTELVKEERRELRGKRLVEGALQVFEGLPGFLGIRLFGASSPGGPAAAQTANSGLAQRSFRFGLGDAAAASEDGVGAGQRMGGGASIHAGVVQHQVLGMDELAFEAERRAGLGELRAASGRSCTRAKLRKKMR